MIVRDTHIDIGYLRNGGGLHNRLDQRALRSTVRPATGEFGSEVLGHDRHGRNRFRCLRVSEGPGMGGSRSGERANFGADTLARTEAISDLTSGGPDPVLGLRYAL